MRATVIFDNFGPYHLARLRAAASVCELTAVQVAAGSAEYAWENKPREDDFKSVTLFQKGTSRNVRRHELTAKMDAALDSSRPQVVFIPGWSGRAAFAALDWCMQKKIPAVAMSESTERDEERTIWKEWTKQKLVKLFSAALVGGTPHKDYMVKLGMPAERIFLGYDAVDNGYFEEKTEMLKADTLKTEARRKHGLPENYFLAGARFIGKKNLPRLIEAYARHRELAAHSALWDLVLIGDGELRPALDSQLSTFNLHAHVKMPGFIQYPDLPAYYGCARAFIHASTTEQWGLVVNEAMASRLPVLVSNRCGCATDLVQEGKNGFTFDPCDVGQLAQLMFQISAFQPFRLSAFGDASRKIIADWGPERFAAGLRAAAESAAGRSARTPTLRGKILLKMLLHRP